MNQQEKALPLATKPPGKQASFFFLSSTQKADV